MQVQRRGWRQSGAVVVLVLIAGVTLYEAAIALQVIPMGDEPGENAFGGDAARVAGMLALLGALVVAVASLRTPEALSRSVRQLLPLEGATPGRCDRLRLRSVLRAVAATIRRLRMDSLGSVAAPRRDRGGGDRSALASRPSRGIVGDYVSPAGVPRHRARDGRGALTTQVMSLSHPAPW
jgi:hypothetical protein